MSMDGLRHRLAVWHAGQCVLCGASTHGAQALCARAMPICLVPRRVANSVRRPWPRMPCADAASAIRRLTITPAPHFPSGAGGFSDSRDEVQSAPGLCPPAGRSAGGFPYDIQADAPDVIVPVPLHSTRLRQRGYNQALEIARPVATVFGVDIDYRACVRTRATPWVSLDAVLRRRNVKGAFELVRSPQCRHVAVVDDVMTTGSTVAEIARLLRHGGAERVDVWVCARAV